MPLSENSSPPLVGQLWTPGRANALSGGMSVLTAQDAVKGRFDAFLKSYDHAQIRTASEPVEHKAPLEQPMPARVASHDAATTVTPHKVADPSRPASDMPSNAERVSPAVERDPHTSAAEKITLEARVVVKQGDVQKGQAPSAQQSPPGRLMPGDIADKAHADTSQSSAVLNCEGPENNVPAAEAQVAQESVPLVPLRTDMGSVADDHGDGEAGDCTAVAGLAAGEEQGTLEAALEPVEMNAQPDASTLVTVPQGADDAKAPPVERSAAATPDSEGQEARSAEADAPQIFHATTDTGHQSWIHMDLAQQGRVRVAIHEKEGEQHIHIAADDQQTLHMLTQDRGALMGALDQTILPGQPISGDVHVTMGLFVEPGASGEESLMFSEHEAGQERDSSHTGHAVSRGAARPSRWMRGVVDLMA